MGITALGDPGLLASKLLPLEHTPQAAPPAHATPSSQPQEESSGLSSNRQQAVDDSFSSAVYQRETYAVSLSARFQEVAARFAESRDGTDAEAMAQQLTFDFYEESTFEQLAIFQERSAALSDGLAESQRARYQEVSQRVSARFEFSMTISATSLQGFADAAEGFAGLDDLFDELLDYTQQLLDEADSLFNDFFEGFAGYDFDAIRDGLRTQIEKTLAQFLGSDSQGQEGSGATAGTAYGAASVQLEFSFSASVSVEAAFVQESDPVMLDLDGDGFELTSYRNGASFDILGNGAKQNTAFVTGGDAFLALDRNGDGVINSGRELFGDQNGAVNGYEELRKLDDNGDGIIDRQDRRFAELLLFRDNGNGVTEEGELLSLADAGIESLSLGYADVNERAAGGNRIAQLASYRRADGTLGRAADAILNYTA